MTSFQLVVADVATGRTRAIRDLGSCVCKSLWPPQVSWSPDGQLIATTTITSRSLTESGDVLLMRPDGIRGPDCRRQQKLRDARVATGADRGVEAGHFRLSTVVVRDRRWVCC